jgi:hypothetical protein
MTAKPRSPAPAATGNGADIDDERVKRERKLRREARREEASKFRARRVVWVKGEKSAAMEEWASNSVLEVQGLSCAAIKLAWTMSYLFNGEDGHCFAKKSKLAERANLSPQVVKNARAELMQRRLLIRERKHVMINGNRSDKPLTVYYPSEPVPLKSFESASNRNDSHDEMEAPNRNDSHDDLEMTQEDRNDSHAPHRNDSHAPWIRDVIREEELHPETDESRHSGPTSLEEEDEVAGPASPGHQSEADPLSCSAQEAFEEEDVSEPEPEAARPSQEEETQNAISKNTSRLSPEAREPETAAAVDTSEPERNEFSYGSSKKLTPERCAECGRRMLALYVDGEEVLCRKHSFPGMPPIGLQNVADLVRQLVADGYSTESAGVALWEGIAQPRLLVMQAAGEAIGDVAAWSLAAGILIEAAATAAPAETEPCPVSTD